MGLDVAVYGNVRIAETEDEIEDYDFYTYQATPEWYYKCKALTLETKYMGEHLTSLRSGYGGHMWFRMELLKLIGREDLIDGHNIKWEELVADNSDVDFFELINFSDCEGCLDSDTSKVILKNFKKYEDKVKEMDKEERFPQLYEEWLEVFTEGAKDGSVVIFR